MNSFLKKTFFLTLFIIQVSSFGQNVPLSKKTSVSVITCDTGNEAYSLFGHTAIRIKDIDNNLDVVFNYGAFDFSTPNFVAKFAKGDLQYFAVATNFNDFIIQYNYELRNVYEQELLISPVYKQKLFDNLTAVLSSSENYYTYKFIDKNCTTMVVAILNKTLGEEVIFKKNNKDKTYRTILYPYFENSFYEKLGTSIIFGGKVDKPGTEIFLPLELHKSLQQSQFRNHSLCQESKTLLKFKKEDSKSWWDNIYSYLIALGLILLLNKKNINLFYFWVMGLLGLFFSFMGYYSLHQELIYNYNILLFNPLFLVLVYFNHTINKKWITNTSVLIMFCLLAYLFILLNKIHLLIVLPLILASTTLLVKTIIQNKQT